MPLLTWTPAFSVGVKVLDDQHKELMVLINRLHSALQQGTGNTIVVALLGDVSQYATMHFATEESLMREFGFAGLVTHAAEHEQFTRQVRELLVAAVATAEGVVDGTVLTLETMNVLKDWLEKHVARSDQKYADFFAKKGVC